MSQEMMIKLFDERQVRVVWDDEKEKYYFSVVDVIEVLTDSDNPRRYWSDLKRKLAAEGSEVYEKIVQLKMPSADGKQRLTDAADTEGVNNTHKTYWTYRTNKTYLTHRSHKPY